MVQSRPDNYEEDIAKRFALLVGEVNYNGYHY